MCYLFELGDALVLDADHLFQLRDVVLVRVRYSNYKGVLIELCLGWIRIGALYTLCL